MANMKFTMLFDEYNQGWSESYYNSASELRLTQALCDDFSQARAGILTPSAILKGIRVTIMNDATDRLTSPRRSIFWTYNLVGQLGTTSRPDITGVAAYLLAQSNAGRKRRLELRGLPDSQTVRSYETGISERGALLVGPLAAFGAFLVARAFTIRSVASMTTTGNRPRLLNQISTNIVNPNWTDFTVDAGDAIVKDDYVQFGNFDKRQLPGLAGSWQVLGIVGNVITIAYKWPGSGTSKAERGYLRKISIEYNPISNVDFQTFTTKQTGRPFSPQRGKKSAVSFRR